MDREGRSRETPEPGDVPEEQAGRGDEEQARALAMRRRVVQRKAREALDRAKEAAAPRAKSGGAPLPRPVRANMEASLGADFSSVRVHEGDQAEALGAVAYTQGDELHFRPGHYDPSSQSGRELLGHELTHVVQQRAGRVAVPQQAKGAPINADESLEAEADHAGARAARGERVELPGGGGGAARDHAPAQRKAEAPIQRFIYVGAGQKTPLQKSEIKPDVMARLETFFKSEEAGEDGHDLSRRTFEHLLTEEEPPFGMNPIRVAAQEQIFDAFMAQLKPAKERGDGVEKNFKPGDKLYGTKQHRKMTMERLKTGGGEAKDKPATGGLKRQTAFNLGAGKQTAAMGPAEDDGDDFGGDFSDLEEESPKATAAAVATTKDKPADAKASTAPITFPDAKDLSATPNVTADQINARVHAGEGRLHLDATADDETRADQESTAYAQWLTKTQSKHTPSTTRPKGKHDRSEFANIAASCKAIIAYTTKEAKKTIHFELDRLDLAAIVTKQSATTITGQELRYVYRQFLSQMSGLEPEADVGSVVFYLNGEVVPPPWKTEPELWKAYSDAWHVKHKAEIEREAKKTVATVSATGATATATAGGDTHAPATKPDVPKGKDQKSHAPEQTKEPAGHDAKTPVAPVAQTVTKGLLRSDTGATEVGIELAKLLDQQANAYALHLGGAKPEAKPGFEGQVQILYAGKLVDVSKLYEAWRSGKADSAELRATFLELHLGKLRELYLHSLG